MTISHSLNLSRVTVCLTGELGHHEALGLMNRMAEIIDVHLPKSVMLDMTNVTFMDSSGIAVVIQAFRACKAINAEFSVRGASQQAMKVFVAAGVPRIVNFLREDVNAL